MSPITGHLGPRRPAARAAALAAVLLAAAAPFGPAAPAVGAAEVVRMGDIPALSSAGLYIAMDKGYFAEVGLQVETELFASAGRMTPALATGQIDVATGAPSAGLFNAIASGMDFKVVADKGQVRPGYGGTTLIVRKDLVDSGQVKSVRDLKGREIAVGARGIALDYFLAKAMEEVGLGYDALKVTQLAYPDGVRALATKAIDGMWAPEPWGAQAEAQGVGVRFLPADRVKAISTFQIGVTMFSGKFMRERPEAARKFLAAYVKGARFYTERGPKDPEVMAIVSKHTKVPVETIQAAIPFWIAPDGRPRTEDLLAFQEFCLQQGWVKTRLPAEKIVDLSFLP
ncbi:MAG TPA: ABC transporter substrate-binding protein [Thermodesulfobacteriota bacterium]|nr:ABC transporter substrate-binding protein [Thermodesulfobacteriota bacterium]